MKTKDRVLSASYESGTETKKAIVEASEKLFLDKGFQKTSFTDICEESYVSRNTVHYHFKTKDAIRDAVIFSMFQKYIMFAKKYTKDESLAYLFSIYMFWHLVFSSEKVNNFFLDFTLDHPVYSPKCGIAQVYKEVYEKGYKQDANHKTATFVYSTVYGYIISLIQLTCTHTERHNAEEVYMEGSAACFRAWGTPEDVYMPILNRVRKLIQKVPPSEIERLIP